MGQKQYLELKPQASAKDARNHPSLGLVYNCPKCKVGHSLIRVSREEVKCGICGITYVKP